jgi:nucleotide-binding universal stress UspA family protein
MLRTILVGLDGTPCSDSAVALGIRWARRFGGLLVGMGVVDEPAIRQPQAVPLGAGGFKEHRDDTVLAHARRRVEHFLERFALRCARLDVPHKVLEKVGPPAECLATESHRFDVLLLGKQTHFAFATQDESCGTLELVMRSTPRPVVAVPETSHEGPIVVAYDGSLQAARALQMFEASGLGQGQQVHVVSVHADAVAAARCADQAVEFLRAHDLEAHPRPVGDRAPAGVLAKQVKDLDAALLVMGAYGQPVWKEFFLGSVTRSVMKDTRVPLFVYH